MFFGIALNSFVFVHTLITLIAIMSGLIVLYGLLGNRRMDMTTAVFLLFSGLTAITGFMIQVKPVTPAVILGAILSVLLILALLARYAFALKGAWRWIYVVSAVMALWSNCFVLVVQTFLKIPALHALVPGIPPSGPVFGTTQGVVLVGFIVAGFLAMRRFHPR